MTTVKSASRDPVFWLAVLLGSFVRLVPAVAADFPINDGGLFASFIDQLWANQLLPPGHVAYNGSEIPFSYPPLGFYLGAAMRGTGLSTLDVLRTVPVVLAILTVPAWYLLASDLFGKTTGAVAAVFFAILPKSFEWLVAGGGITRALGVLLMLLALHSVLGYLRRGATSRLIAGGVLLGLTVLAHPEAGLFGAGSAVLFAWIERAGWRRLIGVGSVALLVCVPWIAFVLTSDAGGSLIAAGGSRTESYAPTIFELLALAFTHEAYVALGAILGAVGLFVAATSGRAWVLTWIGIGLVLVPAASPTLMMLPWSGAAAIATREIVLPRLSGSARTFVPASALGVMMLASVWSPQVRTSALGVVARDVRGAMEWVSENIPASTPMAVVTGVFWARDATGEWFPYLTGARSVGTVQGQEFTGDWAEARAVNRALVSCATQTVTCLGDALATHAPSVELVFVPKGPQPGVRTDDCCLALRESLRQMTRVVYDGPGASIFDLGARR